MVKVSNETLLSPVVFCNNLIFIQDSKKIYAYDMENMKRKYTLNGLQTECGSYGLFPNNIVYDERKKLLIFLSSKKIIFFDPETKKEKSKIIPYTQDESLSIPFLFIFDNIIFGMWNNGPCFTIENEELLWARDGKFSSPQFINNKLVIISQVDNTKKLIVIDLKTGRKENYEYELDFDIYYSCRRGNLLFLLGRKGVCYLFEFNNSLTLKWKKENKEYAEPTQPVFINDTILFSSYATSQIFSIDTLGNVKWKFKGKGIFRFSPIKVYNNYIFVVGNNKLYILALNGEMIKEYELEKENVNWPLPPYIHNEYLVIPFGKYLYLFKIIY
jgi:outer membrane protein assembly factor BamB